LACIIVAVFVGSAATGKRPQPAAAPAKPYGVDMPLGLAHTSSASCSASACHGGGRPGTVGSEHTSWAPQVRLHGEFDPHSNAYRVLFNDVSVRMAKAIGGGAAHENIFCLKCHAPAGVKEPAARSEGVGCSACHGPSEKWIDSHYLPEWKAKSNREKWSDGFVPAKNLTARISNCATCHVGSSDRDVNHDLIAAGHPRLAFEYTRFHFSGTYRKHWVEKTPQPEFEVRAWLIGQAATARAAVDVLHGRAVKAKSNQTPWPEYAGLSCYACHQGVGEKDAKGTFGTPGWEVFHTAGLSASATRSHLVFEGTAAPGLVKFEQLRKLMTRANPNPAEVEPLAVAVRAELDVWLAFVQQSEETHPRSPSAATQTGDATFFFAQAGGAAKDWDALAAYYLGAAAMHHASGGEKEHPLARKPIDAIHRELKFPDGFKSPKGFDPAKVRAEFRNLLNAAIEERSR
jgi:hypothetical protein